MTHTNLAVRLADTIQKRYPHPDNYPYRSWCYPQGFMLMGMIRLYEDTKEEKYRAYALKYADFHVSPDGHLYRFSGVSMDDMMAGAVIAWAYRETKDQRYFQACQEILSKFQTYPRTSKGGFLHSSRGTPGQMWVDGVFMGGMFLTHFGAWVGKTEECFAQVIQQLDVLYDCCHKKDGLLFHAWSEDPKTPWANRITGKSTDVWSEGEGWYAMILAETIRLMPQDHPHRERLVQRFLELLNTLVPFQDPKQGLWYQVVDKIQDPDNWMDTSGSAMFLYAFAQAVLLKLGDTQRFEEVLRLGYQGICQKSVSNAEGLIDIYDACDGLCVQNNYDAYITYPKKVNAKEAVAAVLWAAEAIEHHIL